MPRITITLPDDVHAAVKAEAARTGQTMGEVLSDAFRLMMSKRENVGQAAPRLPTCHEGGGLIPGVDLDNSAGLWDLLDEDDLPI